MAYHGVKSFLSSPSDLRSETKPINSSFIVKPNIEIREPETNNTSEINDKELDNLVFSYFKERKINKLKKYTKIPNSKEGIEQMTQEEVLNSYYIDDSKQTIELKMMI